MTVLGAAVIGFAILFLLVVFSQFTKEVARSRQRPEHLIRMTRGRPAATVFTLHEGGMTNRGGWGNKSYFEDTENIVARARKTAQAPVGVKKSRPR
jgi:hypothetical protein